MSAVPLSRAFVLALHSYQLEKFGGLSGIRDENMLESALTQPFASFGDVDLYPTTEEKAARYAFGIIKNHPFADANKRTGTAAMVALLKASGYHFKPRHADLEQIILGVAAGEKSYDDLVAFVQQETAGH
ncbi:MAG: type II toxin-antitoxin system death-on-curing family toxin [Propionibacteriaceae bacterium]|nr:type II toxin-antitoxin system death-on-curing family toxin [Propionibacteriaceae bacterium]